MARLVCSNKRAFINKHEAKIMLKSTLESPSSLRKECRIYKCDGRDGRPGCGLYHLTSMSIEEFQAEQDRPLSFEQKIVREYLDSLN